MIQKVSDADANRQSKKGPLSNKITVRVDAPQGVRICSMETTIVFQSSDATDGDQYQLFSTETTRQTIFDDHGNPRLFPVELAPPREPYRPQTRRATPKPPPPRKRVSLWKTWKSQAVQDALSIGSKMTGHKAAVMQFCWWYRETQILNDRRTICPEVVSLELDRKLLEKYFAWQLTRNSISTAKSHLSAMSVFWRTLHDLDLIKAPCPVVRQQQIIKQSGHKAPVHIPIGISFTDAAKWSEGMASVEHRWLKNQLYDRGADIRPGRFIQLVLGCSLFYGLNIGDLVAIKPKHRGLQWDDIHFGPIPPFRGAETVEGIEWHRGWLRIHRSKTGQEAWVPICHYLEELLLAFGGGGEKIKPAGDVFFAPKDRDKAWYRSLRKAKAAVGLYHSQAELEQAEIENIVDVYDISMSDKAPSRSCRKRTSITWKRFGNRSQASHILTHSTQSGKVSAEDLAASNDVASEMTERHYGGSEIYPDVVATAPKVEAEIESHLQLYS